jgi:hypothetical protein
MVLISHTRRSFLGTVRISRLMTEIVQNASVRSGSLPPRQKLHIFRAQILSRHKHPHFYCNLNILHKFQCSHATTKYTVKWTTRKQTLTEMKTAIFTKFVQINDTESAASLFCPVIRGDTLCDTKKKAAVSTDKPMTHA